MRVWRIVDGETFEGYETRWLCVDGLRTADLGGPKEPGLLDFASFIVDACNAAEQRSQHDQSVLGVLKDSDGLVSRARDVIERMPHNVDKIGEKP